MLEVAEVKTGIWDVQDTLGRLDAKVRLAPQIAAQRGWKPDHITGALVVMDGTTVRRRIRDHEHLFARYSLRGHAAYAWVRDPRAAAAGLLVFISSPLTNRDGLRRAGQRRVRASKSEAGVGG